MRPKKRDTGIGGSTFRLSSLLPGGGSSSSKNLARSTASSHSPNDNFSSLTSTGASDGGGDSIDSCQLLSVRKRSSSDSGHDSSSVSSHNASPVLRSGSKAKAKTGSSSGGGGFFRFFNRSATLLFQHPPVAEQSTSRRPYKGATSSSTKDLRSSNHPILGNNNNSGKDDTRRQHRHHHRRGLSASSSSSLSSSVMHHHLENVMHDPSSNDLRSLPAHLLRRLPLPPVGASSSSGVDTTSSASSSASGGARPRTTRQQQQPPNASSSSSSNSVISSDYDSGAFSRTSTPDLTNHHSFQRLQAQIQELTRGGASKSSLALAAAAPLNAPKLVIEACKKSGSTHHLACVEENDDDNTPDARLILDCLNAASRSSAFLGNGVSLTHTSPTASLTRNSGPASIDANDVSITIGTNTKLTITPLRSHHVDQSPRRSRSGLPVLGTAGLTSPMKSVRGSPSSTGGAASRSRISTVYLAPSSRDRSLPRSLQRARTATTAHAQQGVSRSESSVTLVQCCGERVTVNGQHYHCDKKRCPSASPPGSQPSSFIDI